MRTSQLPLVWRLAHANNVMAHEHETNTEGGLSGADIRGVHTHTHTHGIGRSEPCKSRRHAYIYMIVDRLMIDSSQKSLI